MVMRGVDGERRAHICVGAGNDRHRPMLETGHISRRTKQAQPEEQRKQCCAGGAHERRGGPHLTHRRSIVWRYSRVMNSPMPEGAFSEPPETPLGPRGEAARQIGSLAIFV